MAHGLAQVRSTVDTDQRQRWWLTRAPAPGRYRPRRLITRWGKWRRARRGSFLTFIGACTAARRRHDGCGASAWDGNDVGAMRTRRRRVRGVGIFIGGRATFYRVEVRRERSGAFNGRCWCLDLKAPVTGVKRRRGCDCGPLMSGDQVKRGKSRSKGWAEGHWPKRTNRLEGRLGWLGWNWREILFEIKIGFLNLPRLWKFAQRDLGGILTQGFFP
jgi:hypothetical protein